MKKKIYLSRRLRRYFVAKQLRYNCKTAVQLYSFLALSESVKPLIKRRHQSLLLIYLYYKLIKKSFIIFPGRIQYYHNPFAPKEIRDFLTQKMRKC